MVSPVLFAKVGGDAPKLQLRVTQMREIELRILDAIPGDVLAMRSDYFPGPNPAGCVSDAFDGRSIHLLIWEESQIVAYVRLTIGPPGVFRTWSSRCGPNR